MNLCPKKLGNTDFHRVNLEFQYHQVSRHRKPQLSEIGPSETCFCEAMAVACLDSVEDKEKFVQDTHNYSEYTSVKVELAKIY
nr:hypothetical protein CFP56_24825 [Quercus suber]